MSALQAHHHVPGEGGAAVTDDDLRVPGAAWDTAKKLLDQGDIKGAERLLVFMTLSDSRLMLRRILEKEEQMKATGRSNR